MAIIKVTNSKATLSKVIKYVTQEEKTEERLVSGINCTSGTALDEMKATKELFNKLQGRQYYHYVQSFSPDEKVDYKKAHQIAQELAQNQFKGFEVLIATHKDREHIHSHIIVNSVSFETGAKFQSSKKDLANLKKTSDNICQREGLNVIKEVDKDVLSSFNHKKYKVLEKAVQGTEKSYMLDLWTNCKEALLNSTSKEEFIKFMEQRGYGVNWIDTRKNITFITPEGKKVRNSNLAKTFKEDRLTKEGMENEIKRNRENAGIRTETRAIKYTGVTGINNEFERRADSLEQQISQDIRLNGEGKGAVQEQRRRVAEKQRGNIEEGSRNIQDDNRQINNIGEASSRETGQVSKRSGRDEENSHGNDKNIKSDNSSSGKNRYAELEGESEAICSSNGNNTRGNTDNSRSVPVNKPIKIKDWDMER